jgi:hypothetical protein
VKDKTRPRSSLTSRNVGKKLPDVAHAIQIQLGALRLEQCKIGFFLAVTDSDAMTEAPPYRAVEFTFDLPYFERWADYLHIAYVAALETDAEHFLQTIPDPDVVEPSHLGAPQKTKRNVACAGKIKLRLVDVGTMHAVHKGVTVSLRSWA